MAIHISSICLFLVLYYYCFTLLIIHGETLSAPPHYQVVNVSSLLPKPYCEESLTSGPAIGSQKVRIVSRYGPCAKTRTNTPSSEQILSWDEARVNSLNNNNNDLYSKNHSEDELKESDLSYDFGEFYVTIGLGTPKREYELMMDTGSDQTWLRCTSSAGSLFDPSKSSTYTNSGSTCNGNFTINYGDGSYTDGIWGCDTLSISGFGVINNFRFGCGKLYHDKTGILGSGILGLGKGEYTSLQAQASASSLTSMQIFSTCLPTTSSSKGNLVFGDEAKVKSYDSSIKYTPLVQGSVAGYYYVDLVGISVAGKRLSLSSSVFTSSGGTIVDSGTTITRLPTAVYSALRESFGQSMSNYTLVSHVDHDLLDTCYHVGKDLMLLPDITFHFGDGTEVTLSSHGKVWPHKEKSIMCLAFAETTKVSIIGNVQQRGMNVIYDLKGNRIGFGSSSSSCAT